MNLINDIFVVLSVPTMFMGLMAFLFRNEF